MILYFSVFIFLRVIELLFGQDVNGKFIGKAYVITTKSRLPIELKEQIQKLGFEPRICDAHQPFGDLYNWDKRVMAECMVAKGDNLTYASSFYLENGRVSLAEIGLICSHRNVLQKISRDMESKKSDWSLVLEDDIKLHPAIIDNPRKFVDDALQILDSTPNHYGFVYFGVCAGKCKWNQTSPNMINVIGNNCMGFCTHAYAVTKKRAKYIYDDIYHTKTGSIITSHKTPLMAHIDQAYVSLFNYTASAQTSIIGYNLISPEDNTHQGYFYQTGRADNVVKSGTTLSFQNSFKKLICFTMNPHESLGALMFQYATLMSLCVKYQSPIDACAYFNFKINKPISSIHPMRQLMDYFQIPVSNSIPCPASNGNLTYKEQVTVTIPYDGRVFDQPSGTIYDGTFQSHRYFESIKDIILDRFRFPIYSKRKSIRFWNYTQANIPPKYESVCISFRKGDMSTKDTFATTMEKENFYYLALEQLKKRYSKLAVIAFLTESNNESNSSLNNAVILKNVLKKFSAADVMLMDRTEFKINDTVSMMVMSMCSNIIMDMASISWWAAYLSPRAEVYVPEFGGKLSSDLYLPTWHVISRI